MQNTFPCPECGSQVVFAVQFCRNCGVFLSWPAQQTNYYLPGNQQKKTKRWLFTFLGLIAISILIGVLTTYGLIISDTSINAPVYSTTSMPQPRPLSSPTPLSPGLYTDTEQTTDTITPLFQWNTVSGANYYSLTISKFPYNSADLVYTQTKLTGTSFMIPRNVLEYGERYCWTIKANNTSSSSVSNTLYFQTPDLVPSSISDPASGSVPIPYPPSSTPVSPPTSVPSWAPVTLPGSAPT